MKKFLMLTGILASLGVPWASATVEVRVTNGAFSSGWVSCAAVSCNFVGAVGNYNVTSNIGTQNNGINPFLDMSYSANTLIAGAGSITFEVIANGYTTNTPETLLKINGNSTLGDTASLSGSGGNVNTVCPVPGVGCSAASLGFTVLESLGPLAEDATGTKTGGGNTVNPYSLGITLTLNSPVNAGNASGDVQLNAVPEPASVMLLGGVLLLTVSGLRRKMRRSA